MDDREDGGRGAGFFAGFLLGAIAGGVLAFVITNDEARSALFGTVRDPAGKVSEMAESLQANASDLYERGKSVVEAARANVDDAVDAGQAASRHIRDDLSSTVNES